MHGRRTRIPPGMGPPFFLLFPSWAELSLPLFPPFPTHLRPISPPTAHDTFGRNRGAHSAHDPHIHKYDHRTHKRTQNKQITFAFVGSTDFRGVPTHPATARDASNISALACARSLLLALAPSLSPLHPLLRCIHSLFKTSISSTLKEIMRHTSKAAAIVALR